MHKSDFVRLRRSEFSIKVRELLESLDEGRIRRAFRNSFHALEVQNGSYWVESGHCQCPIGSFNPASHHIDVIGCNKSVEFDAAMRLDGLFYRSVTLL